MEYGRKTGGEIIRHLRQQKQMTIKQLAGEVGKNYVFLSRMERGMEKPSELLIRRLAEVLGYPGNIDVLVACFGRIPSSVEKLILGDPEALVELPAFFDARAVRRQSAARELI
jgi:transcriptional regulator with XRE-family HTH domain